MGPRLRAAMITLPLLLASHVAVANESTGGPIAVATSLGYAVPMGSAERGARVSDTTFGTVPVSLDAAYRWSPHLGVSLRAQYGIAIPTLCRSAGDCTASLGSDFAVSFAIRVYAPRVGRMAPFVDAGIGYEWMTTRLVEAGASSARSYQGPLLLSLTTAVPFRLGERWAIGPFVGAAAGTFTAFSLDTSASTQSGNVAARAVHAWLTLGLRLEFSP
jgi:hypothetical protein